MWFKLKLILFQLRYALKMAFAIAHGTIHRLDNTRTVFIDGRTRRFPKNPSDPEHITSFEPNEIKELHFPSPVGRVVCKCGWEKVIN